MLADNCYWLDYNALKRLQQILILVHLLYIYLYQNLFLYPLIVSGYNNSNLYPAFILKTILLLILLGWICMGRFSAKVSCFFDDKFKVILNVWDWIRSIRQIKFIIPCGSRYFKFTVFIHWFEGNAKFV